MIGQIFLTHVNEKEFYRPCEPAVSLVIPCNGPGTAVGAASGPTVKSCLRGTQFPVRLILSMTLFEVSARVQGLTEQSHIYKITIFSIDLII